MALITIPFTVTGQQLKCSPPVIAKHAVGSIAATFSFSDEWATLPIRTATFKTYGASYCVASYCVELVSDSCIVPSEVLTASSFSVSVRGSDGMQVLTTTIVRVGVEDSLIDGDTPAAPTPSVYDQLVAQVTAAATDAAQAQSAATAAQANAAAAQASAAAAQASAAAAQEAAEEARDSVMPRSLTYNSSTGRYDNASIKAWLDVQADCKAYGVSIPKSAATGCTKTGANSGIANPIPGIIGRAVVDPYVGRGAFLFYEVNGGVDADGTPYVTAFRGDGRFSRTAADVWILTPVLYWSHSETSSDVEISVSDTKLSGMEVQPQGVLPSGAQRPFMLYAKYWLGEGDGYSRSGQAPALFDVSHNSLVTSLKASTTGYSGFSFADYWYQRVMFLLKYASKNSQSVFAGASNYSVDAAISVAASSQPYVIVSSADAAKFVVGSTVSVGSRTGYKGDARQEACTRDIADRVKILSIVKHDDSNMRLVLDAPAMTTSTAAHVVTMPYRTGACDGVEGDGSPHSCTDGREPFVLQGIELMGGMYEILGDVIFHSSGSGWGVYVNPDSKDEKTAYDASVYVDTGLRLPSGDGVYPLYPGISKQGVFVPQGTGGSTSAGLCDAKWGNADTDTGDREFRSCGLLADGAYAGLWCVDGRNWLGYTWWNIGSRASATGRGVRTA